MKTIGLLGVFVGVILGIVAATVYAAERPTAAYFAGYDIKDGDGERCTVKRHQIHHTATLIPRGGSFIALSPDKGDYVEIGPAALIYTKMVRGKRKLTDVDLFSEGQVLGESFYYSEPARLFLNESGPNYVHVEHHSGKRFALVESCYNGWSFVPWSGR